MACAMVQEESQNHTSAAICNIGKLQASVWRSSAHLGNCSSAPAGGGTVERQGRRHLIRNPEVSVGETMLMNP